MSFDIEQEEDEFLASSLNPFRAGRCLSTLGLDKSSTAEEVSIPLEQGGVFRPRQITLSPLFSKVSIPLEQGGVFRLRGWFGALMGKA